MPNYYPESLRLSLLEALTPYQRLEKLREPYCNQENCVQPDVNRMAACDLRLELPGVQSVPANLRHGPRGSLRIHHIAFLFLVVRPGASSSVLAPSSDEPLEASLGYPPHQWLSSCMFGMSSRRCTPLPAPSDCSSVVQEIEE